MDSWTSASGVTGYKLSVRVPNVAEPRLRRAREYGPVAYGSEEHE